MYICIYIRVCVYVYLNVCCFGGGRHMLDEIDFTEVGVLIG